jgi:hypothetical protein
VPEFPFFIFARIVCCDQTGVVSVGPPKQYPTPTAKSFLVFPHLLDVSRGITEAHSTCHALLHSPCILPFMYIVSGDSSACNLPLKYLFEVILILPVPQVEAVLAVHQAVNPQVLLDI